MLDGVYVLDLSEDKVFVISASSFSESMFLAIDMLQHQRVEIEGSYHYYPLKQGETRIEAESRIIAEFTKHRGGDNVFSRPSAVKDSSPENGTKNMGLDDIYMFKISL
jgi:hypothetical protein